MSKGAKQPDPQNYGQQLQQNISDQASAAPGMLSAMQQFDPAFTGLNLQLLQQGLQGQMGIAQGLAPQSTQLLSQTGQQYIASNPILANLQNQGTRMASGELSPEEQISVDEATNSKMAGTGMEGSMGGILQRILNRGQYASQRTGQAMNIQQLLSGAAAPAQNMVGGYLNPTIGGTAATSNGNTLFNPQSSYAQNIYDTNYNAQMSAYNSQQNNNAGLLGGIIGGVTGMFNFGAPRHQ